MGKLFRGTYTAVITPFTHDNKVDWKAFERIVEQQIKGGVEGIVFMGTTGESPTLTMEEHNEVLVRSTEMVRGRCCVIHGTGSNSTETCLEHGKYTAQVAADGQLVVVPYYNKPTQEGLYRHYMTIADATDVPIIVYNVKSRTGTNMETSTLLRLAKHPNIVAVKEASGDIVQMMDVIKSAAPDFTVLVGDDVLTLPFMACGGDGLISVVSNCIPKTMSNFIRECLAGNFGVARKSFYEIYDLMKGVFIESNPIPIKEIMALNGFCQANFRLPLCNASENSMKQIKQMAEFAKSLEAK